MIFSLATCFGREIDHNQFIYTVISTQAKRQYTQSCILRDLTINQHKNLKHKDLAYNANIHFNKQTKIGGLSPKNEDVLWTEFCTCFSVIVYLA